MSLSADPNKLGNQSQFLIVEVGDRKGTSLWCMEEMTVLILHSPPGLCSC